MRTKSLEKSDFEQEMRDMWDTMPKNYATIMKFLLPNRSSRDVYNSVHNFRVDWELLRKIQLTWGMKKIYHNL